MAGMLGLPVIPMANHPAGVRDAVAQADIICTATNSQTPLFDGAWVASGTHINAVGAYTQHMRELDTATVARSRLFVDHAAAAQAEAGDVVIPMQAGQIPDDHVVGSLAELLVGKVAGRQNGAEITVFKSVGLALQDAVTAPLAYARALAAGMGQQISMG
jgi:ornithine cyclodeaminase/alanine dehydrogenase-like protein (mu-crystallin family)